MASPLSTPGGPRTSSPLTFDEDIAQSLSSSPDDAHAHAVAPQKALDGGWQSNAALDAAAKGKEKAARGPLQLLDLPVDILKEIIHQVRLA